MHARSPYQDRPDRSFWKLGVGGEDWSGNPGLWQPKFAIDRDTRIATAGSCFAQHIARHFRQRGFTMIDAEPAPPGLSPEQAQAFGYGLYSARYGNLYTTRQLLQLAHEAFERPDEDRTVAWTRGDRFFDAKRPAVEPDGLESAEEVRIHRRAHLAAVRRAWSQADLFVFTLGLTEAWEDAVDGTVFPTAPGTIAGSWDPERIRFRNLAVREVVEDFEAVRALLTSVKPDMRFLLTVSPVPLTATATDAHVLPATIYSKSVLRAAAGELAAAHGDVDYFPSYEIIGTPFLRQLFYDRSLRQVTPEGVATVMRLFFASLDLPEEPARAATEPISAPEDGADAVACEEILLEGFAR